MATDVTRLLAAHSEGDEAALEGLMPLVYDELRRLARAQLRQIRFGETLNTTALVHEAYLRLVGQGSVGRDRQHFYSLCARVMRQILVDSARRKGSQKRGGLQPVTRVDLRRCASCASASAARSSSRAPGALAEPGPVPVPAAVDSKTLIASPAAVIRVEEGSGLGGTA